VAKKRKASGDVKDVRVLVEAAFMREKMAGVVSRLTKAGMTVDEVLDCGLVHGRADMAHVAAITGVSGVFSVDVKELWDGVDLEDV